MWSEDWLFAIPDDLPSEHAAPLMCAGSTVWSALQLYPVKATDRVGIVGLGGLGHIAVQFAHAFGCEVVVFSSTESKRQDAMKLGATEFYTATKGAVLEIGKPLDRLLATSSKQPDWETFLPLMNPVSLQSHMKGYTLTETCVAWSPLSTHHRLRQPLGAVPQVCFDGPSPPRCYCVFNSSAKGNDRVRCKAQD